MISESSLYGNASRDKRIGKNYPRNTEIGSCKTLAMPKFFEDKCRRSWEDYRRMKDKRKVWLNLYLQILHVDTIHGSERDSWISNTGCIDGVKGWCVCGGLVCVWRACVWRSEVMWLYNW